MHKKVHDLEIKKHQYRKHLQRLSTIYDKDKLKHKVLTESKSVDKLMSLTHRLHDTSNKFRLKKIKQTQKLFTNKDWSIVNCSVITSKAQDQKFTMNQNNRKQIKNIEKENRNFLLRLMNVKPTVQTHKFRQNCRLTQRHHFTSKLNTTGYDFSDILNSSSIKVAEQKKISIRLHGINGEVIKIRFSDQIGEILHPQKLYFAQVKNNKEEIVESQIFSLKQLLESQFCIYKEKPQKIDYIEIKELFNDMKTISKGYLLIGLIDNQEQANEKFLQFVYPNKKITALGVRVQIKNLKKKDKTHQLKRGNTMQKQLATNSNRFQDQQSNNR